MAKTVSAVTARQNLGELLNRVALANEEITIERAGKKIARLVSCEEKSGSADGQLDFRTSAGLGKELWESTNIDAYLEAERNGWE